MKYYMPEYKVNYDKDKVDIYSRLSKGMKKVIDWQKETSDGAFDTNCSWEELRRKYIEERKFWNEGGPEAYKIIEDTVEGPLGPVPIRIYYPGDKDKYHACIFIHGGGYTVGNNDTHDRIMRSLMGYGDCAVIGIDYTLSPEAKFPTPLYETVAVIEYIHKNADKYNLYADNMAISGDSGGGNMAIAASLYLRDVMKSNEYISTLLLFYPLIGLNDGISNRLFGTELDGMRKVDLDYYENCYITEDTDPENPYYKVINADLTYSMPASYVVCGELDPLLDGNVLFSKIMKNYGFKNKLEIVPGVLHAFIHYGKMMEETIEVLKNSAEFYKETRK